MLRNLVMLLAIAVVLGALLAVAQAPQAWPMLLFAALLLIGTVFERVHYRGSVAPARGGHWRATGERFVDDASGRLVTVWFNPVTGERRYVEQGEDPPR